MKLRRNIQKVSTNNLIAGFFVVLFAAIGVYLLTTSHAATPYASVSATSGTLGCNASTQTDSSGNQYVKFGSGTSCGGGGSGSGNLYNGKLLGMNTSFDDTATGATHIAILQQLGVNSERGEIDFDGTSFGNPANGDGTPAQWIDNLTANHIVPLPLLNQYIEMVDINASAFASATASWCQTYCAGGSFWNTSSKVNYTNSGSPAGNPAYAPQVLEILNEPYGAWWCDSNAQCPPSSPYPVTSADIAAYAALLKDIRSDLNTAGMTSIGILAAANNNTEGTNNWDTQLLADGGFAAAQGATIHAYGDNSSSLKNNGHLIIPTGTVASGIAGWQRVYYTHQFLANAGLTSQANNIYVTEDGWCPVAGGNCSGSEVVPEATKDSNIATAINQLVTVPWIKGFWYFNLKGDDGAPWGLYNLSGAQTCAWPAFQNAAKANGFSVTDTGVTPGLSC